MASGPAIVLGAAQGVWADLRAAQALLARPATIFAVNLMIALAPVVHHAVSHHAVDLPILLKYRKLANFGPTADIVTHAAREGGAERLWPAVEYKVGDSGLLATRIALALGHEEVLLAGVRIDDSPHFYDDPDQPVAKHFDFAFYQPLWRQYAAAEFGGRVRSMSGWTKGLLA